MSHIGSLVNLKITSDVWTVTELAYNMVYYNIIYCNNITALNELVTLRFILNLMHQCSINYNRDNIFFFFLIIIQACNRIRKSPQ